MKTKWIVTLIVALLGICSFFYSRASAGNDSSLPAANSNAAIQKILNATALIDMKLEVSSSGGTTEYAKARGIGSLVRYGGETLLVTHNHWGDNLQDKTMVEISDMHNQSLVKLYGFQFIALVRYQDAGTLVLKAPDELVYDKAALSLGDSSAIQTGDKVYLAYRQTPGRETATLLEATVVGSSTYKGLPRYELRSLNGEPILPGDSGGGMWLDGKLVGNLWTTLLTKETPVSGQSNGVAPQPTYTLTDTSYAAAFPMNAWLDAGGNSVSDETGGIENGMK